MWTRLGVLIPVVVGVVVFWIVHHAQTRTWEQCHVDGFPSECWTVPFVEWEDAASIQALQRPVVFNSQIVQEWQQRSPWTLQGIVDLLGHGHVIKDVFQTKQPSILYYNPAMPMANLDQFPWTKPFVHVDVAAHRFLDIVRSTTDEGEVVHYLSADLLREDGTMDKLFRDLPDLRPLQTPAEGLKGNSTKFHLWAGRAGITSRVHYDTFENFFIQTDGRKTFVLFPPAAWKSLYLFPSLHPSARHGQVLLPPHNAKENVDFSKYPSLRELFDTQSHMQPQVVSLAPGDILYLPPFWFHQVHTDTESVSVNVWTTSHDGMLGDEIMANAVPFVSDRRFSGLVADFAVFYMSRAIIKKHPRFLQSLETTIRTEYDSIGLYDQDVQGAPVVQDLGCEHLQALAENLEHDLVEVVDNVVEESLQRFRQVTDADVRDIHFSNYIQGLANWSVGVKGQYVYLKCLLSSFRG